jgi:hypothetical protein
VITDIVGIKINIKSERRVSFDEAYEKGEDLEYMYFETSALPICVKHSHLS